MKKTLVAIAAIAAATGAMAQSSVTAYGIVDTAYGSGKTVNAAGKQTVFSGLTNSTLAGSRLGFKGTEDIGNGVKANFVAEMSLNALGDSFATKTDGAGAAAVNKTSDSTVASGFNRQTWVGLSGNLGEVRMGYQNTLQYDHNGPFSAAFEGAAGGREHLEVLSAQSLTTDTGTSAASNIEANRVAGVNYYAPTMYGIKSAVQWGAAQGQQTLGTAPLTASANSAASHYNVSLGYDNGPLSTGLVKGQSTYRTNVANALLSAANTSFTNAYSLGASYDLGMAKLFAYMGERTTTQASLQDVNVKVKRIGVQVPVGAVKYFASTGTIVGKQNDVTQSNRKTFQTGALYSLSKRTTLFALYGQDKDDVSLTGYTISGAGVAAAAPSARTSVTRVGINHAF